MNQIHKHTSGELVPAKSETMLYRYKLIMDKGISVCENGASDQQLVEISRNRRHILVRHFFLFIYLLLDGTGFFIFI